MKHENLENKMIDFPTEVLREDPIDKLYGSLIDEVEDLSPKD